MTVLPQNADNSHVGGINTKTEPEEATYNENRSLHLDGIWIRCCPRLSLALASV